MRKRIVSLHPPATSPVSGEWLNVAELAQVEVSSEDETHVIESALALNSSGGWRASGPGEQAIRLIFDRPQQIKRIVVVFEEHEYQRTQEFTLRWSPGRESDYREIVRQQWNFSPPQNSTEVEDYRVDLDGVAALELKIVPDISRGQARASLKRLRLS